MTRLVTDLISRALASEDLPEPALEAFEASMARPQPRNVAI